MSHRGPSSGRWLPAAFAALLLLAPVIAPASEPVKIRLASTTHVGQATLEPATYQFQCIEVAGGHAMVVRNELGKEVARVTCTFETLKTEVRRTELRSRREADGSLTLREVRFQGEAGSHHVAP